MDGEICVEQAEKLGIIRSHMSSLELCKLNLEFLILSVAEKYLPQLNPTSRHLCSWAGLTPRNNESAGEKKTIRISRAGAYIKPLLVQCALAVIKSKNHPEVRSRYLALKKRRGHKKAIIAIARMPLTAIYNILRKKEHYNP